MTATMKAGPPAGPPVATVKTGARTTEFWITLAAQVAGMFALFTGADVGAEAEEAVRLGGGLVAAVSALGYAISRGLAKKGALTGAPVTGAI